MSTRVIRTIGDEILKKKSKEVPELTPRVKEIIGDMIETMYAENGVGLAAVQVGILKRIVVIDCSMDQNELHVMINPVITETEGEQTANEGCLSVPGKCGIVTRPYKATVEYLDENFEPQTLTGEGLLARAICHECDHLEGNLYVDLVKGKLQDVGPDYETEEDDDEIFDNEYEPEDEWEE